MIHLVLNADQQDHCPQKHDTYSGERVYNPVMKLATVGSTCPGLERTCEYDSCLYLKRPLTVISFIWVSSMMISSYSGKDS